MRGDSPSGTAGAFESGSFNGVIGTSGNDGSNPLAAGVRAVNVDGGNALRVSGPSVFSTVRSVGPVGGGVDDIVIADGSVRADSHIMITIASNPGSRTLRWVERSANLGYTLHMTPTTPPGRAAFSFTAFIVGPTT